MSYTGIRSAAIYIPVYIIVITIVWPLMVIIVSIPLGQFVFFRKYIRKLGKRMKVTNDKSDSEIISKSARYTDENSPSKKINKLAIFASGAGSNAQKIIDHFRNTEIKVVLIVCNKPGAGVVGIAEKEGIPLLLIEKEKFFRGDAYLPELKNAGAEFLVLAGFLWKIPDPLIRAYPKKIINLHPALLPAYGGKGMYGQHVHEAVINAGELQTGITIHYVDEHYDNGDIFFQTALPVLEGDTPEKLAHRIHQLEHLHYPRIIEEVLKNKL
jgi:formyltetrahydrofolate-dependent phosphoribosylglycinamide formyltransferase